VQMSLVFITADWPNSLLTRYCRSIGVPIQASPEVVAEEEASRSELVGKVDRVTLTLEVVDSSKDNKIQPMKRDPDPKTSTGNITRKREVVVRTKACFG